MKTTLLNSPIDIRLVSYRLEIGFWRLAIDLLTDSTLLQKLIQGAGRMNWRVTQVLKSLEANRAARWAAAGLSIGFFTALVSAFLSH